jgi:hypothetical protein
MVYHGCCSSPYDRIRFAAVCSSWRTVASWHPKLPSLPLLLPSTGDAKRDRKARAYALEDSRALRTTLRGFPWGKRIVGSHDGGWVAAMTGNRLHVVNVFSGGRIKLSVRQSIIRVVGGRCPTRRRHGSNPVSKGSIQETPIRKIIFSEDPSSSDSILVAATTRSQVALCRMGCPDAGWTVRQCAAELTDIAFCNGKLYGVTHGELFEFVIAVTEKGTAMVNPLHRIDTETDILRGCWDRSHDKYIFELRGKLAIALKFSSRIYCCNDHFFRVFEFNDTEYEATEVTSLGDHALFLGPGCCKAVHVPVASDRSKLERNHIIYHSEQQVCRCKETKCLKRLDLGSYTVYYGKSKGLNPYKRIMSWGYHYPQEEGSNGCIWLLPPDF